MEEQQQPILPPQNGGEEGDFTHQDLLEPQRKKRCIRFASDLSTEDPLLIGDSGFGDLPKFEEEHGDLEVSSYFTSDGELCFFPFSLVGLLRDRLLGDRRLHIFPYHPFTHYGRGVSSSNTVDRMVALVKCRWRVCTTFM